VTKKEWILLFSIELTQCFLPLGLITGKGNKNVRDRKNICSYSVLHFALGFSTLTNQLM
jgi:hypothetical protein